MSSEKVAPVTTAQQAQTTKGFKRINFFKGFLTTEADWNAAEAYHIEKRKLHNRLCHGPGIVLGVRQDLRVIPRARGDLSVEVLPGYAIDGQGNDLVLTDAAIKNINPEEYRLPTTLYLVLRFYEELTDFIAYKENLEYKGHRRVLESAKVEISQTEPDIFREVEIARVYVEKGATRIREARNPADPRANEIDLRFVPKAGIAGSRLNPTMRMRMESVLWQLRRTFIQYTRRDVITGHDVIQGANTTLMLNSSGTVDLSNVFDMFHIIVESQAELVHEVDLRHPTIAAKKEFADYKRHIEILNGLLGEGKNNIEAFTNLMAFQSKACEVAEIAVVGERIVEESKEDKIKLAELRDWEGAKSLPRPKALLELEGLSWVLVDEIDILDKESEDKHEFAIKDAKDAYRSRQKLKYPDETVVEDIGRAHVSGYATYKLLNLAPGRPLVILRRMDYVYGDYEIEYFVDGKSACTVSCSGTDRIHRWRNWPALIDGSFITQTSHVIKQLAVTAGRDVNMFHIWVYQQK